MGEGGTFAHQGEIVGFLVEARLGDCHAQVLADADQELVRLFLINRVGHGREDTQQAEVLTLIVHGHRDD